MYLAEISEAGRTLGEQSRISKDLNQKIMKELNEVDKSLYTLGREQNKLEKGYKKNADRGKFLNSIDFLLL